MTNAFSETNSRVAIVGGGLAGLTAAYRLQQMGIQVEVFEARERAGGRVLTYHDGEYHEELGGKFLGDGEESIHIKSLINELGLTFHTYDFPLTRLYYQDGKAHDMYQLFESAPLLSEENHQALIAKAKESKNMLEILQWFFSEHPTLLRLFNTQLAGYEGSPTESLGTSYVDLFWKFYCGTYEAASKQDGGASSLFTYEVITGGASRLIEELCAKLEGSIRYHSDVRRIWGHHSKQITLEFADGKRAKFDQVILAIPCSTLRDVSIEPSWLPEDQIEAIQTLQYGTVGKVLFRVNVKGEEANFCFGDGFVTWFNEPDRTFMTLYFGGDFGKFDPRDSQVFKKRIQECLEVVHVLFPSVEIIGEPIPMSWALEKYSKGSYSNFGIDQYEPFNQRTIAFGEAVKKVFRPVEDRIFFAGEHTALKYFATMEGAVESGERAARMLANSRKK